MFRLSGCVGLTVPQPEQATQFYAEVLGAVPYHEAEGYVLELGSINLFLDPGPLTRPVFELAHPMLDEARRQVVNLGFEVMVWRGPERANLVRDPFGLIWNIYEDATDPPVDLSDPDQDIVRPVMGMTVPNPDDAAAFWSRVLDQPATPAVDHQITIPDGPYRVRIRRGDSRPVLYLSSHFETEQLAEDGFKALPDGTWRDPYGVWWAQEESAGITQAAVRL